MTHSDAVPILVDHHHAEKHAKSEEEEPIDVMLDGVADCDRKGEEDDLRNGEERSTEDNVANRPAVLEGSEDEDELRYNVDNAADKWPKDVDYPETDWLCIVEACNLLERRNCDKERYAKYDKSRQS